MTEPANIDALIAEARKLLFSDSAFGYEDTKEGDLIFRLAAALESVYADRARRMGRAENSDNLRLVEINTELLAERDRLHKAITEALAEDIQAYLVMDGIYLDLRVTSTLAQCLLSDSDWHIQHLEVE